MITVLSTDLLVWAGRVSRCVAQAAFALSPPASASLGRLCATTPHTVETAAGHVFCPLGSSADSVWLYWSPQSTAVYRHGQSHLTSPFPLLWDTWSPNQVQVYKDILVKTGLGYLIFNWLANNLQIASVKLLEWLRKYGNSFAGVSWFQCSIAAPVLRLSWLADVALLCLSV